MSSTWTDIGQNRNPLSPWIPFFKLYKGEQKMNYLEFKKLAIKARWYFKEMRDYSNEISNLFTQLCHGDRNVSYFLLVAWTCWPDNPIYRWSIVKLYDEIQKIIL